jgi:arabinogalactan endo-1,4-beta-galactosidase
MISRYGKEVMICEVGMPWDEAENAKLWLTDLITRANAIDKCLGVFYWEPEAHNGWKGYTLGAFDNSGKPTAALDAYLPVD